MIVLAACFMLGLVLLIAGIGFLITGATIEHRMGFLLTPLGVVFLLFSVVMSAMIIRQRQRQRLRGRRSE